MPKPAFLIQPKHPRPTYGNGLLNHSPSTISTAENYLAKENNIISRCCSLYTACLENFSYVLCYHRLPQLGRNRCFEEKESCTVQVSCGKRVARETRAGSGSGKQTTEHSTSAARAAAEFPNSGETWPVQRVKFCICLQTRE